MKHIYILKHVMLVYTCDLLFAICYARMHLRFAFFDLEDLTYETFRQAF